MKLFLVLMFFIKTSVGICQKNKPEADYFMQSFPTGNAKAQDPSVLFEATIGGSFDEDHAQLFRLNKDTIVALATLFEDINHIKSYKKASDSKPNLDSLLQSFDQVGLRQRVHKRWYNIQKKRRATDRYYSIYNNDLETREYDLFEDYQIDCVYADETGFLVYAYATYYHTGILKWIEKKTNQGWEVPFDQHTEIKATKKQPDGFVLFSIGGNADPNYGEGTDYEANATEYIEIRNGKLMIRRKAIPSTHLLFFNNEGSLLNKIAVNVSYNLVSCIPYNNHILYFYSTHVVLINAQGKEIRRKKHALENIHQLIADNKNNVYVVSQNESGSFYISKMAPDFGILWTKEIASDPEYKTVVPDLKITSSNKILITVKRSEGYSHEREAWSRLISLSPDGKIIWEHTMAGPSVEEGNPLHYINKVIESKDGLYYVLSSSSSIGHVFDYFSLTCIDSTGTMRWRKFVNDYSVTYDNLLENQDGNVVLIGWYEEGLGTSLGGLLTVMNKNGSIVSNALYPAEEGVFQEAIRLDNSVMVLGSVKATATDSKDYWLLVTRL